MKALSLSSTILLCHARPHYSCAHLNPPSLPAPPSPEHELHQDHGRIQRDERDAQVGDRVQEFDNLPGKHARRGPAAPAKVGGGGRGDPAPGQLGVAPPVCV